MKENVWSTDDVYIDRCGKYDNKIFNILLSQDVYFKINCLMNKFPRLEWLAYLVGDIDYSKRTAYVNDLIIPNQKVSTAKVHDIMPIKENSIGVIHSHHVMGNAFSKDDEETINKNNDISLLVSNTKITGQIRIKTECGVYYNMPVKVEYDFKHNVDIDNFIKDIDSRIEEKVFKVNGNTYPHIPRSVVNFDEDGRRIYGSDDELASLFNEMNDIDDIDDDDDKVLTYEDLINSDDDLYEKYLKENQNLLFNKHGR